jgi:hypothetical protein
VAANDPDDGHRDVPALDGPVERGPTHSEEAAASSTLMGGFSTA